MKNIIIFLIIFTLLGCGDSSVEDQNVINSFRNYIQSILNNDGTTAYSLVDQNTRKYYEKSLILSQSATKNQIEELGILDKMQIIIMRHRIPPELLLEMTGKDLFVYAVNNGWVGKNSVSQLDIGNITLNDKFAKAVVVVNGQNSPLNYHFYKEDEIWKIDITEMSKWGEAAMIQQLKESGMEENEYIFSLTQIISGKKVEDSIWTPLK